MTNPMSRYMNQLLAGLGLLVFAASWLGCAARTPVAAPALTQAAFPETEIQPYRLQIGDHIAVKFWGEPQLDQDIVIRPDGLISLPFVNEIEAAGLTPAELKAHLTELYRAELATPDITVVVRTVVGQTYFIGGEVANPGSFPVEGGITLYQAIQVSGGFMKEARRKSVIVIRTTSTGERIAAAVNMMPIVTGEDPQADFQLQTADIVFVPRVKVLSMTDFLQRYFYDLLPVRIVPTIPLGN